MKSIKNVLFVALLVVVIFSTTGVAASSEPSVSSKPKTYRYGGVWLTVIKDLPPTVQVGKTYTVKLKYENRYKNRRNSYKRQDVKSWPWMEWGSVTYPSKNSPNYTKDWESNKAGMKVRKLKPRQSRKVTYRVSFDKCLPPWGQDWGGLPGDDFYWGLPCASGFYYFRTSSYTKGYHWSNYMSYPYEGRVFVVPAANQSATPTPTGPTGPTG